GELCEQSVREMQSRSGCGDRAALSGIDGLIPFAVRVGIGTRDVGRKRHVPVAIDCLGHRQRAFEAYDTRSPFSEIENLRREIGGQLDAAAGFQLAARRYHGLPPILAEWL